MTPDVRRTLRNRARYEVANNAYAKGMVLTIAGDCVGTGPRLQLLSEDNETNRIVEQAFAEWATAADLAAKLRTMRMAKATDGEAFAVLVSNPTLDHPVKLDLRPIEADRVTSPPQWFSNQDIVDGIGLRGDPAERVVNQVVYDVGSIVAGIVRGAVIVQDGQVPDGAQMIGQGPEHLVGHQLARLGIVVQALLGQDLVHGRAVEHAPAGTGLVVEAEHHVRAVVSPTHYAPIKGIVGILDPPVRVSGLPVGVVGKLLHAREPTAMVPGVAGDVGVAGGEGAAGVVVDEPGRAVALGVVGVGEGAVGDHPVVGVGGVGRAVGLGAVARGVVGVALVGLPVVGIVGAGELAGGVVVVGDSAVGRGLLKDASGGVELSDTGSLTYSTTGPQFTSRMASTILQKVAPVPLVKNRTLLHRRPLPGAVLPGWPSRALQQMRLEECKFFPGFRPLRNSTLRASTV